MSRECFPPDFQRCERIPHATELPHALTPPQVVTFAGVYYRGVERVVLLDEGDVNFLMSDWMVSEVVDTQPANNVGFFQLLMSN